VDIHVLTFRHCCGSGGLFFEKRENEWRVGNRMLYKRLPYTIGMVVVTFKAGGKTTPRSCVFLL
jgi:hypothetical protein